LLEQGGLLIAADHESPVGGPALRALQIDESANPPLGLYRRED
jgi:hypothetical protein